MNYVTLYQFKRYRRLDLDDTSSDDILMDIIERASQSINILKGRHYDPIAATRSFKVPIERVNGFGLYDPNLISSGGPVKPLRVDDDLLEVSELSNGDGTLIEDENYVLEPLNDYPKYAIRLVDESWYGSDDDDIQVAGIWGTHYDYDRAWVDSLDTIQDTGGISESATLITVADADGAAGDLKPTRFQVGSLTRIGTEFCLITAVDTTLNTIHVARHFNGSTAAAHAKDSKIEIWRFMGNIVQACLRMAAWMYVQKDQDVFDRTYNTGTGIVTNPTALPVDIWTLLGAPKARIS